MGAGYVVGTHQEGVPTGRPGGGPAEGTRGRATARLLALAIFVVFGYEG